MTKDEAKRFIRQYCADVDAGLEELKQLDELVVTVRQIAAEVMQKTARDVRSGAVDGEHIERMAELLDAQP